MSLISFKEFINEKTFDYSDFSKNKYSSKFLEKIKNNIPLKLGAQGEKGNVVIVYDDVVKALENDEIDIKNAVFTSTKGDKYTFRHFFKGDFSGAGTKAGKSENQERALVDTINNYVNKYGYVKIKNIPGKVIGSYKKEGMNDFNHEPYIDIYIQSDVNGRTKLYGVSCKGLTAPSLAGGGLIGLNSIDPKLVQDAFKALENYITKKMKLEDGSAIDAKDIPDFHYKVPKNRLKNIIVGNVAMGGPIDYMYIGPKNNTMGDFNTETHELKFKNGNFISSDDYTRSKEMYIRFRKRDLDVLHGEKIKIDFKHKSTSGFPVIYTSSKKRTHLRIVITDKPSRNSIALN